MKQKKSVIRKGGSNVWYQGIPFACILSSLVFLSACSDDSSGTNAHIDTGDEISFDIPTGNGSSSSKIDTLTVIAYDDAESSSSVSDSPRSSTESSSSVASPASSAASSSSATVSSSSASENAFFNEGWREDCLAKINEYRATEGMKPLALASDEKQTCADKQSADDLAKNSAHGHFKACGEWAQNSGPNFSTSWQKNASAVAEYYLDMMWDEKKLVESGERDPDNGDDFSYIGHYLNMKNSGATTVACGIALSADGKTGWFNVDFF